MIYSSERNIARQVRGRNGMDFKLMKFAKQNKYFPSKLKTIFFDV